MKRIVINMSIYLIPQEFEILLKLIPQSIGEAIIATDLSTKIRFVNCMAEKLTGYTQAEAYGEKIFETLGIFTKKNSEIVSAGEVVTNNSIFRFDNYSLTTKNGNIILIAGSISPIKTENNKTIGLVFIFYNVTEQRRLEKQLHYVGMYDALTGLYNRAWFEHVISCNEGGSHVPIGIIVCDVDGLKIINDTMGHRKGDELLISAAKILKECFREGDMVARIGGDEFTVLLPRSSVQVVRDACKRIKQRISNYNDVNSELPLSVSLGFSVSNNISANISSLFQEADNNMYKEKLHHKSSIRGTIVSTIMSMIGAKDFITEGHCERLKNFMEVMALSLGFSEERINDLRLLGEFHDIGKVGIPDSILLKEDVLTDDERKEMQRHCEIGSNIASSSPDLSHIANWIHKHHEWWNGNGYPLGLKGENIPIECRIISIVDAYDAMTNDRPYRKAMSQADALAKLKIGAGTQFDPLLVTEFIRILKTLKIYVASSMKDAMLDIKQAYLDVDSSKDIIYRFNSSGNLMKQIKNGALVDIFISAASRQMDELQMEDLIFNNSRKDLLRNRIVLITSKESKIECGFEELTKEKIIKIGIGDPAIVPAGRYAQEVLISLGILEVIKSKLILANDVRQVLNYVETGNVDVGIVYQSDVTISNKVKILDCATDQSHSPIVYPVAVMKNTSNKAESENFMKFLTTSDKAGKLFRKYGFKLFSEKLSTGRLSICDSR